MFPPSAADPAATTAVDGQSMEEVANAITVDFSTSPSREGDEVLVEAEVRLFREPLNADEIVALEAKCDLSNIDMELMTRTTNDDGTAVVEVASKTKLFKEMLGEQQSIVFKHIMQQYMQWTVNKAVSLSFAMSGACSGVSPSEFGVNIRSMEALIVGYHKLQESPSHMEKRFVRQSQVAGTSTASTGVVTDDTYKTKRCQLYNHTVSIAYIHVYNIYARSQLYITIGLL